MQIFLSGFLELVDRINKMFIVSFLTNFRSSCAIHGQGGGGGGDAPP